MALSRRALCRIALMAAAPALPSAGAVLALDIRAIERDRVLRLAVAALDAAPLTITAFPAPRSPGGPNDYYSEGDYWWPDPAHPGGPYIRRDGYSNPDKFTAHRDALIRLGLIVPALAAAWRLTGEDRFVRAAAAHFRAWFVDPATMMAPRLDFAQRVIGQDQGRSIGIIDTLHLVETARAALCLEASRDFPEGPAIRRWFGDYLTWLCVSPHGRDERSQKNNHGSCWLLQALQFAALSGEDALMESEAQRFLAEMLPAQIAEDGRQTLELARTKPYSYCLFNLDIVSVIAHLLGMRGIAAWSPRLAAALAFMFPFIADKSRWPYPPDVEAFEAWPVRQVQLLFGGLALGRPDYLALWRRLDPDPSLPEAIRNFPIRQPVLWVD